MTGFPKAVRDLVKERSQGSCEVCGFGRAEQLHHRRARGMGSTRRPDSNTAANCLAACSECHAMIESRRTYAYDRGWLVRQHFPPEGVPVVFQGDWALLHPDGTVFRPPAGRDRCERCGFHIPSQGHRYGCQVKEAQ